MEEDEEKLEEFKWPVSRIYKKVKFDLKGIKRMACTYHAIIKAF